MFGKVYLSCRILLEFVPYCEQEGQLRGEHLFSLTISDYDILEKCRKTIFSASGGWGGSLHGSVGGRTGGRSQGRAGWGRAR